MRKEKRMIGNEMSERSRREAIQWRDQISAVPPSSSLTISPDFTSAAAKRRTGNEKTGGDEGR